VTDDDLLEILTDATARSGGPGLVLAVQFEGKAPMTAATGLANLEEEIRLTPEALVNVGSVAKQFTAMTTLIALSEAGLPLSTSVRTLLPGFSRLPADLTLDHLLLHQSGIPDFGPLLALRGHPVEAGLEQNDVLELIARQLETIFAPGSAQLYSNSNYVLLAEALRALTGSEFPDLARRLVFEPLSLTNVLFRDGAKELPLACTRSYTADAASAGGWLPADAPSDLQGPDNLYIRLTDLLAWEAILASGKWKRDLAARLCEPATVSGTVTSYTRGRRHTTVAGYRAHGHAGSQDGHRAEVWSYPSARVVIAAYANYDHPRPLRVHEMVLDHAFSGRRRASLSGPVAATPSAGPSRRAAAPVTAMVFDVEAGDLWLARLGPDQAILRGPSTLSFAWSASAGCYLSDEAGQPMLLRVSDEIRPGELTLQRSDAAPGQVAARLEVLDWAAEPREQPVESWAGSYYSTALNCDARLEFTGDRRALFIRARATTDLIRFCPTGFAGDGIVMRLVRDADPSRDVGLPMLSVHAPRIGTLCFCRRDED
jgi:CubicO group peptidase (beta-lactamase class C family)